MGFLHIWLSLFSGDFSTAASAWVLSIFFASTGFGLQLSAGGTVRRIAQPAGTLLAAFICYILYRSRVMTYSVFGAVAGALCICLLAGMCAGEAVRGVRKLSERRKK